MSDVVDTLADCRKQIQKITKDLHKTNTSESLAALDMWMALHGSISKELLDLRFRVQALEDKLGVKQKIRVSKG